MMIFMAIIGFLFQMAMMAKWVHFMTKQVKKVQSHYQKYHRNKDKNKYKLSQTKIGQ